MRFRHVISAVAAAGMCAAAATAQAAAGSPTSIPGVEWDELTKAVRAIASAGSVEQASAAYAKGCAINRQSIRLQDAYMRRMLKFGRPDLAVQPARELLKLQPDNAVAWGVIAYEQCIKAQYLAAVPNALRAAELDPQNSSICHNAAQLVAWCEGAKIALNATLASRLKKFKDASWAGKTFTDAYNKAKQSYARIAAQQAEKKKQADAVMAEAKKIQAKAKQVKQTLASAKRSYDSDRRRLRDVQRSIDRADDQVRRSTNYTSRRSAERRRDSLFRQMRDIKRSISRRLADGAKIKKQLDDLEKQWKGRQARAARLMREAAAVAKNMPADYTWLPPAVDGVVTPDVKQVAAKVKRTGKPAPKSYLAPTTPKDTAAPPKTAPLAHRLAEAEAADKLSMAKILVTSSNEQARRRGGQILREIISRYPQTKAAAEAKRMLAEQK
ncbi:MAG: hypothetical protein J7M21_05425 [Planctomycetes bacterium]|nr:hypothetical protein [Planctomycetota bacterium]